MLWDKFWILNGFHGWDLLPLFLYSTLFVFALKSISTKQENILKFCAFFWKKREGKEKKIPFFFPLNF